MDHSESVVSETSNHITIIRFNRPRRLNALNSEAISAFRRFLIAFRDDPEARVCVITGTGDRGFCAGADLKETMPSKTPFAAAAFLGDEASIANGNYIRGLDMDRLAIGKPLIAAVNGHAVGGGMEIAMACDIRVASTNATFGLPEVKVGSIPAVGGIQRLVRSVPHSRAMQMILTGDPIDAAAAERIGLVSAVVPLDELMAKVLQIASRIAENAPLAVRAARMLAQEGLDMTVRQAMLLEQFTWGVLRDTEDRVEGRKAFAEKRRPSFKGS